MSESTQPPKPNGSGDSERTKQVTVVGWLMGVSAFAALGTLYLEPSWPVAAGVTAVAGTVAAVSLFILRRQ